MPIQKVSRAGGTVYKVQVRRRGFPPTFKSFERYADARAFEERTLREHAARAAYGCNVHLTLGQAIDAYLASEEYAKLRSDRKPYHDHWKRRLGDRKLCTLNRAVYQGEAEWLVRNAGPRGRTRQTVAVFMSTLGRELKYATQQLAADARALAEFRCCSFGAESKVRGRALEPFEMTALLAAADAAAWKHWGLLVRLLLVTAGRKSDLLERRRRDVDLDAGTITVPITKNGDPKVMFVVGETLDLLRQRCEGLAAGDLLFPGRNPSSPLDPKKGWKGLVRRAGLPADCTLHWLRKTCATRLLRAGVDVASVAKVTGHRTHTVLLKHYASAGEARQREVVVQHAALLLATA